MAFVSCSFAEGSNNVLLESHTPEGTGDTWTEHANFTGGAMRIDSNRVRCSVSTSVYLASGLPAGAEYDVEAVVHRFTNAGLMGIVARVDTAASTMYIARYSATTQQWDLAKMVAGTVTVLQSFAQTLVNDTDYTLKLEIRDAAKKLYVDGVERCSSADNTITAAGRVGIYSNNSFAASAGYPLDSFAATDVGGAPPATTAPVRALLGVGA